MKADQPRMRAACIIGSVWYGIKTNGRRGWHEYPIVSCECGDSTQLLFNRWGRAHFSLFQPFVYSSPRNQRSRKTQDLAFYNSAFSSPYHITVQTFCWPWDVTVKIRNNYLNWS
jgi:hypothetical protein